MSEETLMTKLKSVTHTAHDNLDHLITSYHPFTSKENYGKFLQLQEVFHRILEDIYKDNSFNETIPDLPSLARHDRVVQDMADLNIQPLNIDNLPKPTGTEAIGWLYCAEGSNLGAAFLFKEAQALGLDEKFGANHLAAHPDGRGKHWREFSGYFNKFADDDEKIDKIVAGANNAFAYYTELSKKVFA